MPLQIRSSRDGAIIGSLEEWRTHAPPKGHDRQWVEGRSALELARAWCPDGEAPSVPEEISALLASHRDLHGLEINDVYPERRVRIDTLRGEPRNADLVMVARRGPERVAVSVEAKADEPFGQTISAVREAVERRIREGVPSRGLERIDHLLRALLPEAARSGAEVLRYQLFTAAAGALAFAREVEAARAVLVVHEFVADAGSRNVRRNAADLNAFVAELVRSKGAKLDVGSLLGPIEVPGSEFLPAGIPLYIGKVRRTLTPRSAGK